jgi:hypothetical protein
MVGHFSYQRKAGSRPIGARRLMAFLNLSTPSHSSKVDRLVPKPMKGTSVNALETTRSTYDLQVCSVSQRTARKLLVVDFAGCAFIFFNTAGEPQWLRGPIGRPLEPDAGNAAEGSEGPMPDG